MKPDVEKVVVLSMEWYVSCQPSNSYNRVLVVTRAIGFGSLVAWFCLRFQAASKSVYRCASVSVLN